MGSFSAATVSATAQDYGNAKQAGDLNSPALKDQPLETRNEVLYSNALRALVSRNIPVLDSAVCDEISGTSYANLPSYLRRIAFDPFDWHNADAQYMLLLYRPLWRGTNCHS